MLGRALRMALWIVYDHLGGLLVLSILWGFAVTAPLVFGLTAVVTGEFALIIMIAAPCLALAFCICLPVMTVGIAFMVKETTDARESGVRSLFTGIRLHGLQAIGVGVVYTALSACLLLSAWFYAFRLGLTMPFLGYGLSALALWALLFLGASSLWVMPALVQKKAGAKAAIRLACLLTLSEPGMTLGLAAQIIALTAIAICVPPLLFLCYGGVAGALTGAAYEMLSRKYEAIEKSGGKPWRVLRHDVFNEQTDAEDDLLNRGFRDFIFPWKG